MKNIYTKILTGVFLAVFVTAFGVPSVFAAGQNQSQTQGGNAAPATGTGQCEGKCTGRVFTKEELGEVIKRMPTTNDVRKNSDGTSTETQCNLDQSPGSEWQQEEKRPRCYFRTINNSVATYPMSKYCKGEGATMVKISEDKFLCKGEFDELGYWTDKLRNFSNVLLAPFSVVIFIVSYFFQIVSGMVTDLAAFALDHAYTFFSNDKVKDFIFDLWKKFTFSIFTFYVAVFVYGAVQMILGVDDDHATIKKFLPRVLGSMAIVSLSFVFFLVMLDLGNIFTDLMYGVFGNIKADTAIQVISSMILPGGIEKLSNSVAAISNDAVVVLNGLFVMILSGVLLLSFLTLAFVMVKRTLILIVAAFVGPFAGLAFVHPQTQSFTSKWATTLAHHAILPAILAFFVGLAVVGAEQIKTFAKELGSGDPTLFPIANYANGGLHLSDLMVIIWMATLIYYGATKAISTEYTQSVIGFAEGIGGKVKGFFEPALRKTGMIAGVGAAATGTFGGTAAAVTWGAAGYKGLGMGYNATEAKIMEIGKKRLTGYSKDALDKTPLANKAMKWLKASEEVYEKKEASKDDNRKMATSTVAAEILKRQANRASGDEAKKLNNMADSHLMKIRNEDFADTVKKNEHLTGYDMQNKLDNELNLMEDILKKKDPAEITTAINENSGLLRAGYKILADNGQLQDWKSKHPEISKEDWKRLEAHLFLTPNQALRYDELLAEKATNPGVTTSVEYVELENAIHTASGNYVTKDFEMMKKNGERAMMRKLDQAGKTEGNDTAVADILFEELERGKRDPKLLSSHDRGAMLAVVDRLSKISPKVLPSEMQKLLAQLSEPDYLDLIVRVQNGYALDQLITDPKDIEFVTNKRKELVKMFHFSVGNKDPLIRENKDKDGALMSVSELLNGDFDGKGDFQIYARNRIADENKFLDNFMSQFTRVKEADLGEVKPEVLKAFAANILRYKNEILADRQQRGWEKTLRGMLKRIENADFVGGADQKIVIGNTLRQLFPDGWDK